jgi:hypothetical protein
MGITLWFSEDGITSEWSFKNLSRGGAGLGTNPEMRNAWNSGIEIGVAMDDRHHRGIEMDRGLKILGFMNP